MTDFPLHPYPWQLDEWQQFNHSILAGKLPHALMFAGPKGIGKRHLAESLAQLLLCHSPLDARACGKCKGCALNKANTHPDLLWVEPEEAGKAIKVDQIRELTDALSKTAQQSGYKVVIIDPAEAMNTNSANALLKSLEEPAANTLLILIAHSPSGVLPTIRSRCQLRVLPMPRQEQVLRWLSPLLAGREMNAQDLLVAARGAPLLALSLLDSNALEQQDEQFQQWVKLSLGQISAIDLAASWHSLDAMGLIDWLLGVLHMLARWRGGNENERIQGWPVEFRDRLQQISLLYLHRYLEKVLQSKKLLMSSANPNKQMMWEELLMDWGALLRMGQQKR